MATTNTTTGLYINSSYLALARADVDEGNILNISIQPLDTDIEDLWERIGVGLDTLFEGLSLKKENISLALPGEFAVVKTLSIDNDDEDVEETIKWELSQQIVESLDEYAFDYQTLPNESSDSVTDYFITAYRQSAVSKLADFIKDRKQNPVVVELDIFALVNVYEMNYPDTKNEPAIIIFSESDFTKLILTQNGKFIDLETIQQTPETNMNDEISDGVTRLLKLNKSKLSSTVISVFLTGDNFSEAVFLDSIKSSYPEAKILYPFEKLTNVSGISEENLQSYAPRLGVSVGLAMRDAEII